MRHSAVNAWESTQTIYSSYISIHYSKDEGKINTFFHTQWKQIMGLGKNMNTIFHTLGMDCTRMEQGRVLT
jgi:hypothetical protein